MVWAYMGVSLGERCSIADLFCNVPRNLAILDPDVFKIGCLYFEIGFGLAQGKCETQASKSV